MAFGVRVLTTAMLCCLATAIVLVWRIGPVVFAATPEHGLHTGDLLALPVLFAAASLHVRVRVRVPVLRVPVLRVLPIAAR